MEGPLWAMGSKAVKRGRGGMAVGGCWRIRQRRLAYPQTRPLEEAKSEHGHEQDCWRGSRHGQGEAVEGHGR